MSWTIALNYMYFQDGALTLSILEFKFANNYILFESAIKINIIIHGNIGTVFKTTVELH